MRFEKGTSEARETCRGHVSVPVCVPAQRLRRANLSISAKQKTTHSGGFFVWQDEIRKGHIYVPFGVPYGLPLPLPLGEVAEHSEAREGTADPLSHLW